MKLGVLQMQTLVAESCATKVADYSTYEDMLCSGWDSLWQSLSLNSLGSMMQDRTMLDLNDGLVSSMMRIQALSKNSFSLRLHLTVRQSHLSFSWILYLYWKFPECHICFDCLMIHVVTQFCLILR